MNNLHTVEIIVSFKQNLLVLKMDYLHTVEIIVSFKLVPIPQANTIYTQ